MQECTTSGSTVCKLDGDVNLPNQEYCITTGNNIYIENGGSGNCVKQESKDLLIKSNYKDATAKTDNNIMIYIESTAGVYEKLVSLYYLKKTAEEATSYIYKCNDEGKCSNVSTITAGSHFLTKEEGETKIIECLTNQIHECTIIDKSKKGYYLNSGDDNTTNPVYSCDGSSCQAVSLTNTHTSCKDIATATETNQIIGGIIKVGNKINICVAVDEYVELKSSATASAVYKEIILNNANDFPEKDGTNIIIKITNDGRVYKLNKATYVLNTCDTNCSGSTCSRTDEYYVGENNKLFYQGEGGACTQINSESVGLSSGSSGFGYIYFDSNKKKVDIATNPNDIVLAYQCTFVSGVQTGCTLMKHAYFYDSKAGKTGKAVYCNNWKDEECIVETAASSCSSGDEGKIIYTGNKAYVCFNTNAVEITSTEIYTIFNTVDVNKYYGKFGGVNTLLELKDSYALSLNNLPTEQQGKYFINQSINSNKESLIYCDSALTECKEEIALKGYYVNGSGDDSKKIIKCTSESSCEPATVLTDKCITGNVYWNNDEYYLCLKTDNTVGNEGVEDQFDGASDKYHTMTIASSNDFPTVSTANTVIDVKYGNKKVVLLENASLPECPSTIPSSGVCVIGAEAGQHCFHSSTNKIYMTTKDGKCSPIVGTAKSEYLFFDIDTKRIPMLSTSTNSNKWIIPYECQYTTSEDGFVLNTCSIFKGYLINTTTDDEIVINCNGWKGEGCTIGSMPSGGTCTAGKEGSFVNANKLCMTSNEIELGDKMVSAVIPDANQYFGVTKSFLFLSFTSRTIKVAKTLSIATTTLTGTGAIYYVSAVEAGGKGPLMKCINNSCEEVSTSANEVYLDGSNPFSVIICEDENTCQSDSGYTTVGYAYIDSSSKVAATAPATDPYYTNIITCSRINGCTSSTGKTDGHVYIDALVDDHPNIITCASKNGHVECSSGDGVHDGAVYLDATSPGNVIQCSSASPYTCSSYEANEKPGNAYIDAAQQISGPKYRSIITCQTGTCVSSTKTAGTTTYYIDGTDNKNIITCSGAGDEFNCISDDKCTSIANNNSHVSFDDGTISTNTIYCFMDIGCLSVSSITPCASDTDTSTTSNCKYSTGVDLPSDNYCWHTNGKLFYSTSQKACTAVGNVGPVLLTRSSGSEFYSLGSAGRSPGEVLMNCDASGCVLFRSTNVLLPDSTSGSTLKFIYRCDDNARCVLINNLESSGIYVSGLPSTNKRYTSLIQCVDKEITNCKNKNLPSEDEGTVYYIDREIPGNIITCTNENCVSVPSNERVGYLDEEKAEVPDDAHPENRYYQYVITCKNRVCTSENKAKIIADNAKISELTFKDNSASNKIITCKYDNTAKKIICTLDNATAGKKYIDGIDPNATITCDSTLSNCVSNSECRVTTGVNCKKNTYYLVKDQTNYFIGGDSTNNNKGYLYYCEKSTKPASGIQCSHITNPGYYINKEKQYYTCKQETLNIVSVNYCVENTQIGQCSGEGDVGKIFIDKNLKIALCLDGSKSAPINSQVLNYLLSYHATTNQFSLANSHFALINSNENSFTQDTHYNFTNDYFIYINPTTQEVLVESEKCPDGCYDPSNPGSSSNPNPSLIKEYKCPNGKPDCEVVEP